MLLAVIVKGCLAGLPASSHVVYGATVGLLVDQRDSGRAGMRRLTSASVHGGVHRCGW